MKEWKKYKIGDVFAYLKSGKGIHANEISSKGEYPVYGGNGVRGYTTRNNFEGNCAIIGRQGAIFQKESLYDRTCNYCGGK